LRLTGQESAAVALLVAAAAVTGRFAAGHHTVYESGCTAHPFIYGHCVKGAIANAGPAFHTPVSVLNYGFLIIQGKDFMRTNLHAHPAPCTLFRKDFNGCCV